MKGKGSVKENSPQVASTPFKIETTRTEAGWQLKLTLEI